VPALLVPVGCDPTTRSITFPAVLCPPVPCPGKADVAWVPVVCPPVPCPGKADVAWVPVVCPPVPWPGKACLAEATALAAVSFAPCIFALSFSSVYSCFSLQLLGDTHTLAMKELVHWLWTK
jgi:hypothetical protein